MNTDKIARLNLSPIIAACIIAAGLAVAAAIDAHKPTPQAAGAANAQSVDAAVPSEASVRQQFTSQINTEYAGKTEEAFGRHQTYSRMDIVEMEFATKGDKINIVYSVYWNSDNGRGGSTDVAGCTLTKDDYGHFTNANETLFGSAIQPHLDIQ